MKLICSFTILVLVWVPGNLLDVSDDQSEGDQNKLDFSWPFALPSEPSKNNHLTTGLVRTPCRRRNNDPQSSHNVEQWMSSLSSKIVKPNVNDNLKSESLRSYNNNPKSNETENKNVGEESVSKQEVPSVVCYHVYLPNELQNGSMTEKSIEPTEQLETESSYHTGSIRRKIQNIDLRSDDQLDSNTKTGLFKLCSEIYKNADQVLKLNDENRRYLNEKNKNQENVDYVERNQQDQQGTHKETVAQISTFDATDISKIIPDKETSDSENLTKLRLRLWEPTKAEKIADLSRSQLMLSENNRVCYACNSASDPTCWEPNSRTTVKYCRKDHDSCVIKTYKDKHSNTVIRDCAKSCLETDLSILEPKYTSCSVCQLDLCNAAYSLTNHNTVVMGLISFIVYIFRTNQF